MTVTEASFDPHGSLCDPASCSVTFTVLRQDVATTVLFAS